MRSVSALTASFAAKTGRFRRRYIAPTCSWSSDVRPSIERADNRAEGLSALIDAFERLDQVDATASRQCEYVHHVARQLAGLYHHDSQQFSRDPRPNIAVGNLSLIFSDTATLRGIRLHPLADNWRVLALIEAMNDVDVGAHYKSLARQVGDPVASIEASIIRTEYCCALKSHDIDASLRLGFKAVSAAMTVSEHDQPDNSRLRLPREKLHLKSVDDILESPIWGNSAIGLLVDVVLHHTKIGVPDGQLISRLRKAWFSLTGRSDTAEVVLKAATGLYAVGPAASFMARVAASLALGSPSVLADPAVRLYRDLNLVMYLAQAMGRPLLERKVALEIAAGWQTVITEQRFALAAPDRYCPELQETIDSVAGSGLRGVGHLLLAAAPAARCQLNEATISFLGRA